MMRIFKFVFSAVAVFLGATFSSPSVSAHENLHPLHGGRIIEVQSQHFELTPTDGALDLYLSDHGDRPISADGAEAKAALVLDGKKIETILKPAGSNKLSGAVPGAPSSAVIAKSVVIVTVQMNGKTVMGKFGVGH
ncbi:putative DUF2846 domain-containing protein [Azospirillaceae bacterium]